MKRIYNTLIVSKGGVFETGNARHQRRAPYVEYLNIVAFPPKYLYQLLTTTKKFY
jgi:hypothetical protein